MLSFGLGWVEKEDVWVRMVAGAVYVGLRWEVERFRGTSE